MNAETRPARLSALWTSSVLTRVLSALAALWALVRWTSAPVVVDPPKHVENNKKTEEPEAKVTVSTSTNAVSHPLFPQRGKLDHHVVTTTTEEIDDDDTQSIASDSEVMNPTLCSTGLTTQIMPFKNENGELEWTFADKDSASDELDAFRLSPSTSNESSKSLSTPSSSDNLQGDANNLHACPYCSATFKIRGYLTRHLKKHATKKAYSCPFHQYTTYVDDNNITHKCHPNGGFSRRDTYKTHLKSRHFKYPKGTRTKERGSSSGSCGLCGEYFNNPEIWCEIHIEGGQCKFLPPGFKGKSRILKKLEKQGKQGILADLVPNYDVSSLTASQNSNPSDGTAGMTPSLTPNSNTNSTPQGSSPGRISPAANGQQMSVATTGSSQGVGTPNGVSASYDYNHSSPAASISSSIPPSKSPPVPMNGALPQSQLPPPPHYPQFTAEDQMMMGLPMDLTAPMAKSYPTEMHVPAQDDYDDEFCLDTDQLYMYDVYQRMMEVPPQFSFTA
ncbi:hypothetical protein DIURU_005571 [Diutina rugosa]|uniref:C2H2-type domain-containing protein n=1 Tax=Diutina rugosa TaxID=5481 RepID=A0A642UCV6_DIURU|nr:uncharacterized protein DIURU_005571 [Diutina rugosa]KAA8896831.1 hypothetical protein DIURU_005571 [Diutina rugosa]